VNFSSVWRIRELRKAEFDRRGVKLTPLSFVAKAVVDALARHPMLNSSLVGDTIVYKRDVHLGIAVALDDGLIVPVIRNAGDMDLVGLSGAIADLAQRARRRQLRPEDVQGGTFTITNHGVFGDEFAVPIINQPQVAILGIGSIAKRPVVVDDAIGIRMTAYLTLGFDHRLIDGVVADRFMADVKRCIETFHDADVEVAHTRPVARDGNQGGLGGRP
jgi:2-oxoglutarate dehydrogenase E2 component (dihydrolipoamide succinyltransferase)